MHAGVLAQLRLHLVTAKPWQRALFALGLLVIGVAAGLLVLDGLGALLLVTTAIGWWRARHGAAPREQRAQEQ
jgi:hypothetical protein